MDVNDLKSLNASVTQRMDAAIEHVRRELNTEADRLANEGVDDLLSGRPDA